jgi:hypothetical protein
MYLKGDARRDSLKSGTPASQWKEWDSHPAFSVSQKTQQNKAFQQPGVGCVATFVYHFFGDFNRC